MAATTSSAQSLALWAGITAGTLTTVRNVSVGEGVQLRPWVGAGIVVLGLSAIAVPAPQIARPLAGVVIIGSLLQSMPALQKLSRSLSTPRKAAP